MTKKLHTTIALGLCAILWWTNGGALAFGQKKTKAKPKSKPVATIRPKATANSKRPRLVLLLTVDQFRYDYLERFAGLYSANGLGYLLRKGALWTNADYDHFPTYTAPGHATLLTGAWPAETGIIANEWPDFAIGKSVTSVSDDQAKSLGGDKGEEAASPRRLLASTVGDEMRLASGGGSRVIGISLKARAAILPVGRSANAAYWFGGKSGTMVSSDYYFPELPAWVTAFNAGGTAQKYCGQTWTRLLDADEYKLRAGPDDPDWEAGRRPEEDKSAAAPAKKSGLIQRVIGGLGVGKSNKPATPKPAETPAAVATDRTKGLSFPHTLPSKADDKCYEELAYTPFANDLLVSFAQAALTNENLGKGPDTDLLSVSFSANDYIGHRYGPYSQEVMDISLRVDRSIATLLDAVNRQVGAANVVVIFTADHGVAPIPEHAADVGLPGARILEKNIIEAIRQEFKTRFKYVPEGSPDNTVDYIVKMKDEELFAAGNLYLNYKAVRRDGFRGEDAENAACVAALSVPGVARCFTRSQLEHGAVSPADPLARRVLHGYYPRRSGDIVIVTEAYKYLGEGKITVATHGSPYTYDTHVPLLFLSPAFKPGRYADAATPADIAPTLAYLLGLQAPSNSVGRILREGLKPESAK